MTTFFIFLDTVLFIILVKMFYDIFKSLREIRNNPEYLKRFGKNLKP